MKIKRLCIFLCNLIAVIFPFYGVSQAGDTNSAEKPRLVVQTAHGGFSHDYVRGLAFSPNGKLVASSGDDGAIKIWNVSNGKELRTLVADSESGPVTSVKFSPNGKYIFSVQGGVVKIWDVLTGKEIRKINFGDSSFEHISISPDGKSVVAGGRYKVKIYDINSGDFKQSQVVDGYSATKAIFTTDGRAVVSANFDGTVKYWNRTTDDYRPVMIGHNGVVWSVAVSPDRKALASGGEDKTIRIWDINKGSELKTLVGHKAGVFHVEYFSGGSRLLSVDNNGKLKVWDTTNGEELPTVNSGFTSFATVSPDGKTLVTAGELGKIRFWDLSERREVLSVEGYAMWPVANSISPDGSTLAVSYSDYSVELSDFFSGSSIHTLLGHKKIVQLLSFSPDGKMLLTAHSDLWVKERITKNDTNLALWSLKTGEKVSVFDTSDYGDKTTFDSVGFSPDGKTVMTVSRGMVILWDVATGAKIKKFSLGQSSFKNCIYFSKDSSTVTLVGANQFNVFDAKSGSNISSKKIGHNCFAISENGKTLAMSSPSGGFCFRSLDLDNGTETFIPLGLEDFEGASVFSFDGNMFATVGRRNVINLVDVKSGQVIRTFSGHTNWVSGLSFSSDGKVLISSSKDRTLRYWEIASGRLLATRISFIDGRWAVVDPEGRFDVADLEDMPHLHWVMPDDPLTPLPLETFMRDYYEPRLLARIMNGEKFKPVRALGELNRVQPEVRITRIEGDSKTGYAKVIVEAEGASRAYGFSSREITTAAHDLRLFRNGQLVGYADGKLAESNGKPFQRTFRIRLPSGQAALNFTAYAFNDDRVKSSTTQQSYTPPPSIATEKPRAYLITIGVNRHDNPAWNLRYAANDARQISRSLAPLLQNQKSYEEVVTVPLISDSDRRDLASKANIKAVLDVLAGRKADVSGLPSGDKLHQASPDDLVLISFAGHGFGEGGLFYLISSNTGTGRSREVTPELTASAISSDELSAWLRDVDAGNMAMIVDACHSAASVGDEFKPGPMGSRGLGQLAFDKGMRILAASQADDVALESDLIKQGLLSFALVENGLKGKQADFKPKDKKVTLEEWLSYGVIRVPPLAEEVKTGKVVASRGAVRTFSGELKKKRVIQQPALFDFTKGRRDAVLDAGLE